MLFSFRFEFALTGLNEENVYMCQEAGGFESIGEPLSFRIWSQEESSS